MTQKGATHVLMRVLAASFMDNASAHAARDGLSSALGMSLDHVRIAGLAQPSDLSGPAAILAGRFEDDVVATVRTVVERHGGTLVADIEEARTHS